MDLFHALLLIGAGIVGGAISTLVGGASVVTFPALLAAGLPPVIAVSTNMAAMTPGNLVSAFTERAQLPPFDRAFVIVVCVSLAGAVIGALLLLLTPNRLFEFIVPILLGLATVLFAFGQRISRWLRDRAMARHGREPEYGATSIPILLPVSIYGGYFGAGAGVMLLAVFSIWSAGDYRTANVTKNLVTSLNSLMAAIVFAVQGTVDWRAALLMMAGGIAGSSFGVRIARIAPRAVIQVLVIAMGVTLTSVYAWRYWF
jgi:uncharacterized membrane protein YfcA